MQMFVRVAVVALVSTLAVPASAALIQYDFTAGGEGVTSYADSYNYVTGQSTNESNNFSLSARFILDTSLVSQAAGQSIDPGIQSYYDNYSGGAAVFTATATKTGGSIMAPVTAANARSYFYAYDEPNGSYEQIYLHAGNQTQSNNEIREYHANGNLARQYYRDEYIAVGLYGNDDIFDFGVVDGVQVITDFNILGNTYLQIGYYFYEYRYDENGNQTSYENAYSYATGQITSANVGPVTTDVPEPATLSLLGLGLLGLALRRRNRA